MSTNEQILIKPEDEGSPVKLTSNIVPPSDDALAPNAIALEKLLKQDLDINTEELEDLMDDFDIDDLMNKPVGGQGGFPQ